MRQFVGSATAKTYNLVNYTHFKCVMESVIYEIYFLFLLFCIIITLAFGSTIDA